MEGISDVNAFILRKRPSKNEAFKKILASLAFNNTELGDTQSLYATNIAP